MSVPALVMNCLAPSITHSPSSRRARVRDVAGVRAGLRLGQPEGAELAARGQLGSHSLLLLLAAEQVDRLRAERGVRAHRDRHRGVHARELLDRDRVGERVAAARRRTPPGTGSPSARARRAWRRSRRGSASRGPAPRRPARPRPRRSRGRCGGSARGRGRGRSPCGHSYQPRWRVRRARPASARSERASSTSSRTP